MRTLYIRAVLLAASITPVTLTAARASANALAYPVAMAAKQQIGE